MYIILLGQYCYGIQTTSRLVVKSVDCSASSSVESDLPAGHHVPRDVSHFTAAAADCDNAINHMHVTLCCPAIARLEMSSNVLYLA